MIKSLGQWSAIVCLSMSMLACGPYSMPIQQGNHLAEKSLMKVHTGMTAQELHTLLGSPALNRLFRDQREIYIYSLRPSFGQTIRRELIVTLSHGRVSKIERRIVK